MQNFQTRSVPCEEISSHRGNLRLKEPCEIRLIRDTQRGDLMLSILCMDQEQTFPLTQVEVEKETQKWVRYLPGWGTQTGLNIETPNVEVFFLANTRNTPRINCVVVLEYSPKKTYKFKTLVWQCSVENNPGCVAPGNFVPTNEPTEIVLEDLELLAA